VDVHKTFFVATLITTEGIQPTYRKRRFSTFNNQILAFKAWLLENNCRDVCMESTGKYWVPVFNLLEDSINVIIANPKWVRAVKGNKDDAKDSKQIGNLFRIGLVPGSFIPGKDIRTLREYTRYRSKLVSCKSSEKNRCQNVFTVCNVALDAGVSDMFGKSASSVTDCIVNSDTFDPDYCVSLLQRSLKKKANEVVESIDGFQMSAPQKHRAKMVKEHYDYLLGHIQKSNASPYYRIKYERISKRRGKKRAIIAIARMILTALFHMLETGEVWNPTDLNRIDMPPELREKEVLKSLRRAAKLLADHGLVDRDSIRIPTTLPA
jgi:hypothetical protein